MAGVAGIALVRAWSVVEGAAPRKALTSALGEPTASSAGTAPADPAGAVRRYRLEHLVLPTDGHHTLGPCQPVPC